MQVMIITIVFINSMFHVLTTVHDTQEEPSSCFIVYIITDSLGLSH